MANLHSPPTYHFSANNDNSIRYSTSTMPFFNAYFLGSLYVALSLLSVVINALVCIVIIRSKLLRSSPKYWMVLSISIFILFQSVIINGVIASIWLSQIDPKGALCWVWKICVLFSNYIVPSMVTYTALLILVDFLLCLLSSKLYVGKRRCKTMTMLITSTYVILFIVIVAFVVIPPSAFDKPTSEKGPHGLYTSLTFAHTKAQTGFTTTIAAEPATLSQATTTNTTQYFKINIIPPQQQPDQHELSSLSPSSSCWFHIHQLGYQKALLWITIFFPIILSVLCVCLVALFRFNKGVTHYFRMDTDVLEFSVKSSSDLILFLIFEIIGFLPKAVLSYLDLTCPKEDGDAIEPTGDDKNADCSNLYILVVMFGIMADNIGVFLPVSWFLFKDMHNAVKSISRKMLRKVPTFSANIKHELLTLTVSGTSEVQMVDMYPYCMTTSE